MTSRRFLELSAPLWAWLALTLPTSGQSLSAVSIHPAVRPAVFPVPESLHANVQFWREIYGRYTSDQVLIHDDRYLDVVYEVVELGDLNARGLSELGLKRERRRRVRQAEERARLMLRELAGDPEQDDPVAELVRGLLREVPGTGRKYRDASWRVRSQTGLRNRFEEAVRVSGRFIPGIERILKEERVPTEISAMPFVESMFDHRARSKVGASGAWQFTLGTGRLYLSINSAVDERSDVLLAARGAARKLRDDYEHLGSWPLALTAYNHGRAGMSRAVQRLGTRDIGHIAERYRSRTFGFASRNFYAEFVAALIVYEERATLFPEAAPDPELRFDELALGAYVPLPELAGTAGAELAELRELNPALSQDVFSGSLMVPRGYPLRIPLGTLVHYQEAYAAVPDAHKRSRQSVKGYRVRSGDTLGSIARRFGTTVAAVQRANGLSRPDRIFVGQYLRIPARGGRVRRSAPSMSGPREAAVHVVRRGDTLEAIARFYGATESELVAANGLSSADRILVGQRIDIPAIPGSAQPPSAASPERRSTYTVRRGDTLFRIARLYGTTVDALVRLNRLRSSVIKVGQVLQIPAARGSIAE